MKDGFRRVGFDVDIDRVAVEIYALIPQKIYATILIGLILRVLAAIARPKGHSDVLQSKGINPCELYKNAIIKNNNGEAGLSASGQQRD